MPAKSLDLEATFMTLRLLLARYQPPLVAKIDDARRYELWSEKDVVFAGRRRSEVFFASAVIQKGYVGFYYMPVYIAPDIKRLFAPDLLSLLKGKSCFHIRVLDGRLEAQVERALVDGFKLYKKNGWV